MNEWLGEHSQCYQTFMTEGQLRIQAKEFLHDGAYSSDIGDLAIAALSNMLQSPLVLFTSRPNQPLHIQHPSNSPMINPHPIYICLMFKLDQVTMMLLLHILLNKIKMIAFLHLLLPLMLLPLIITVDGEV